jgi:hypothetical protein
LEAGIGENVAIFGSRLSSLMWRKATPYMVGLEVDVDGTWTDTHSSDPSGAIAIEALLKVGVVRITCFVRVYVDVSITSIHA